MRLKRFFIASILTTIAICGVHAQNGMNMPFSQYSITQTDLPNGIGFADAMGGLTLTRSGSTLINPFNPASYGAVQQESFLFDISANLTSTTLSSNGQSVKDFDGSLASISIAFPILKWWKTALGIMPYNITNYESVTTEQVANTDQRVKNIYDGNGSVTQLYWGHAFNILDGGANNLKPALQAGFNINYLFGSTSRAITYDFLASDTSYFQDTRRQKDTRLGNLLFDLGLQYFQPLGENYHLNVGLTCRLPHTMSIEEESLIYTFISSGTSEYIQDTIFPARGQDSKYTSTLEQPATFGIGLSLERNSLWTVGIDVTYSPCSGMKYSEGLEASILGGEGIEYTDNYKVVVGGGWLGNSQATSYWRRIGITGGFHYNSGKLTLNLPDSQWSLDEWGVGFGLTLPMRKGRSKLLLTCTYNSYGTTQLLRCETLNFGLTLSSNEHWFMKRKYN